MTAQSKPDEQTVEEMRVRLVTPYQLTLGMELLECSSGRSISRMKANRRIAKAPGNPNLDPLALMGFIDQGLSQSLKGLIAAEIGISTFDLRIGLLSGSSMGDELTLTAEAVMVGKTSATVTGSVTNSSKDIVGTATGLFRLGSFPGGAPADYNLIGDFSPQAMPGPMSTSLGLSGAPDSPQIAAGNRAVLGWESGNIVHGGAVAAALMSACQGRVAGGESSIGQQLESIDIRYLRPAVGSRDLFTNSCFEREGKAASFVRASCFHEPEKPLATAIATFVR
jgi:acyl-coenzyme A thioesterase PaaI-like protein